MGAGWCPDGEPRGGSSAVDEPCSRQAELARVRGRLMFSLRSVGRTPSFSSVLILLAATGLLKDKKEALS